MEFVAFNIYLDVLVDRKDSKLPPSMSMFMCMMQVYSWTGENNYIVRGAASNLVIGSSDGGFGIWLDESFNQGRSQVKPLK